MNFLIISAITLFSSVVMASPSVGDSASYELTANGTPLIQKVELTAFNPSTQTYTQLETIEYLGQVQTQSTEVQANEIISDAQIEQVLTSCQALGGVPEIVATKIGNIETCALSNAKLNAGEIINIGRVPFGIVQIQSSQISGKIFSFKKGN